MENGAALLEVRELVTAFQTERGSLRTVDRVSFDLKAGEVTCIVGESGCGKSVTSYSIMGLVSPPGKVESGEIRFEGDDLLQISKKKLRMLQGNRMSMIFQEPLSSLNPLMRVGDQIAESIRLHQKAGRKEVRRKTIEMIGKVGIPMPEKIYHSYPHELSGGMRQRVMIAMALACNPKLLIADEPTTALDVTIQAQILKLLRDLKDEYQTAILLITHDLGVVAEMADRVIVMYAGQIVEEAGVKELFRDPKHPYTQGLMRSTPKIHEVRDELESIGGTVPAPGEMPDGCRFAPRCPYATDICQRPPALLRLGEGRDVRCWLHEKGEVTLHGNGRQATAADGS